MFGEIGCIGKDEQGSNADLPFDEEGMQADVGSLFAVLVTCCVECVVAEKFTARAGHTIRSY